MGEISVFGRRLRRRREELKLSQTGLARLANVERVLISNIESGRSKTIFLDNAVAIARVLGVSVDFLVSTELEERERESELEAAIA